MLFIKASKAIAIGLLVGIATQSAIANEIQDTYYKAYYLETEKGDFEAAAKLYAEVAESAQADQQLKSEAGRRLAACKEEMVAVDMAALMPPGAWVYAEVSQPGDHVKRLLRQLGLLGADGQIKEREGKYVAVSPALINAVLGIRGAAVACTGFNPILQMPSGVAVFHPGDVDAVRGLIETGIPAGGDPVDSIGGYPTYMIEKKALVTLTSRLVIVSTDRAHIEGVIKRLKGESSKSLANDPALQDVLGKRNDSLVYFCVNAKPIMPMMMAMAGAGGAKQQDIAMMRALLDPEHVRALVGRIGVGDDGVSFDLTLNMDADHQSMVFHLLRTPAVDRATLETVPKGVAAFAVGALNESGSRYQATTGEAGQPQSITLLDFGREIFANIRGVAIYALPPGAAGASSAMPIPDIAASITVNDPGKSELLWTQMLGLASLATGAQSIEGESVTIHGREVRSYTIENKVTVYFASLDDGILVSPSRSAMERSLAARQSGQSVLNDPAFAKGLERFGPGSTKGIFAHAQRCYEMGKPYMSVREREEAAQWVALLTDTAASLIVEHSDDTLGLYVSLTGIPDVSEVVAAQLNNRPGHQGRVTRHAEAQPSRRAEVSPPPEPRPSAPTPVPTPPPSAKKLNDEDPMAAFERLVIEEHDMDNARKVAWKLYSHLGDKPLQLNNFAWRLLTEKEYYGHFNEVALKMARRANELTEYSRWEFLDTLAWAHFESGDPHQAVKYAKQAIEHSGGAAEDDLAAGLARFQQAAKEHDDRTTSARTTTVTPGR